MYTQTWSHICAPWTTACLQRRLAFRDDWFRHELDSHRIATVWLCQTCMTSFSNSEGLVDHLREMHDCGLEPDHLSFLVSMCRRRSQVPVENQICALCGVVCSNAEDFKTHVAFHFEQFSLTSITYEGRSTQHNLDTQLENFLCDLRERTAFAKKNGNASHGNDTSGSSDPGLQPGSSDGGLSDHQDRYATQNRLADAHQPEREQNNAETFRTKVERYLHEQSKTSYDEPFSEVGSIKSFSLVSESVVTPLGEVTGFRSIRTMPPTRNQSFVGRADDLDMLHQKLTQPGSICVLSGVGGIGKSATAIEYTYVFEQEYSFIFWIQAETPVICAHGYGQIATHLCADENVRDQERLITMSREFLEQTKKRWLLVFDNVDDMGAIRKFVPSSFIDTCGSILITSRDPGLIHQSKSHNLMQLGLLAFEDCCRLLLTATGDNPRDMRKHHEYKVAGDIATYAGRLPLALSQIAGYIEQSKCNLADFKELWEENVRRDKLQTSALTKDCASLNTMEKTLEMTWNIGLREVTTDAKELLNILAFLDSDAIQRDLLVGEHEDRDLEFLHITGKFRQASIYRVTDLTLIADQI